MLEAVIDKAVVVQDPRDQKTVLLGTASYGDERVNFRAKFDWQTLDKEGFLADLREKLAEDFDLPVYRVHIAEGLLRKMDFYAKAYEAEEKA